MRRSTLCLLFVLTTMQTKATMSSASIHKNNLTSVTMNNTRSDSTPGSFVDSSLTTTDDNDSTDLTRPYLEGTTLSFKNESENQGTTTGVVDQNKENTDEVIHISHIASCTFGEIIRNLTLVPDKPQMITVQLMGDSSDTPNDCWLRLRGPARTAISVLLLNQTCNVTGSVKVVDQSGYERNGRFHWVKKWKVGSGGLDRHWVSCQRSINPGPDYLTSGHQVYLGFTVTSAGWYTATLHAVAVHTPADLHLHRRYISTTLGYIQIRGIHLHPGFQKGQMNMFTYRDNLDTWSHLTAPPDHLTLPCDDRVELTGSRGSDRRVLWTLCSEFQSLPPPELIGDTVHVSLHFVSHGSRITPDDFPLKHGCGVRVVFSFHKAPNIPRQVEKQHLWNCSVNYWPELQAHFDCNLLAECAGGEDESRCFYTPCGNKGVLLGDLCYFLLGAPSGVTWHEANERCSRHGGRLAALKDPGIKQWLVNTLRLDLVVKSGKLIFVGVRTTDSKIFMYRNLFQWTDDSMYFATFLTKPDGNIFTEFGYLYPISVGMAMTYFKTHWKLQTDCKHVACQCLCEKNMAMAPGKSGGGVGLANPNTSSVPFRFVHCPLGHVTHSFLVFDFTSHCFEAESTRKTDCAEDALSPACQLDLDSFPPPFTCTSGLQHVPYSVVCDHRHDCQDKSDEDFCSFPPCDLALQIQCHNGKECLPRKVLCDGVLDCADSSDELSCRRKARIGDRHINPPYIVSFEEDFMNLKFGSAVLTQLNDTATPCPDTHFRCPTDWNCLPVYTRCNGVIDCSNRVDEEQCQSFTCPNHYRCRGSQICLNPVSLCDGMVHCPEQDDERFCDLTCSVECVCFGHSRTCRSRFAAHRFPKLKYLDGEASGMKMREVANNTLLIYLNLAGCDIREFDIVRLPNLLTLVLNDNSLQVLSEADIRMMPNLRNLHLIRNPLSTLLSTEEKHKLEELDVSGGNLRTFHSDALASFSSLRVLDLSHNKIENVEASSFHSLPKTLHVLRTEGCPIKTFPPNLFEGLNDLQTVNADNYKLCCKAMLPPGFLSENCQAPFDEVSSCEDLLRSNIYRVPLLVLASLALLGNVVSFLARTVIRRKKAISGFGVFVLHLCFSDFMMGVYLVFIGVADRMYQGRYLWEDLTWKHSVACKLAGFVSLASSEVSAFMICLITVDRFIVLRFPFTKFRFGYSSAQLTSAVVWTIGIVLALMPLLPVMSHWQFYSQTGICIPLPVTRSDFLGHGYAFGVMIILNFFLFLLIASGQAFVYVSIQSSKMSDSETSKKSQDATIARRLITVVVSDFLCWFPIGLLGLLANSGVPVPGEVSVAMAIFVLPLNSALNPFLYTFNMIQEYTQKRNEEKLFQKILLHKDASDSNIDSM
ncbi:hypothetical protein ACOMHN_022726 [Nucella lapillus]